MANLRDDEKRKIVLPSVVVFVVLIIGAAVWTYSTRDWNAAGNHKIGSQSGSAPSEGGSPPLLNR
jgi:hypothetical protein